MRPPDPSANKEEGAGRKGPLSASIASFDDCSRVGIREEFDDVKLLGLWFLLWKLEEEGGIEEEVVVAADVLLTTPPTPPLEIPTPTPPKPTAPS